MQTRERELHLGLDARGAHDAEPGRPLVHVVQQRGLADARLTAQDQHAALTVPRLVQQLIQYRAFCVAATQAQRHALPCFPGRGRCADHAAPAPDACMVSRSTGRARIQARCDITSHARGHRCAPDGQALIASAAPPWLPDSVRVRQPVAEIVRRVLPRDEETTS